jgi:hypothetical protein
MLIKYVIHLQCHINCKYHTFKLKYDTLKDFL